MTPRNEDAENLPLPPKSYCGKGRHFEPMSRADGRMWQESYNEWVALWNKHERSKDPLSPEWKDAQVIHLIGRDSVLVFRPWGESRTAMIRLRKWKSFDKGWSFCRIEAHFDNVIWAGWETGKLEDL